MLDRLAPRPRPKNLIARLPDSVLAGRPPTRESQRGRGSVPCLDATVRSCSNDNPPPRVDTIAAVVHDQGTLYIGTLTGAATLRLTLDEAQKHDSTLEAGSSC